jgi:hypothetical protein
MYQNIQSSILLPPEIDYGDEISPAIVILDRQSIFGFHGNTNIALANLHTA